MEMYLGIGNARANAAVALGNTDILVEIQYCWVIAATGPLEQNTMHPLKLGDFFKRRFIMKFIRVICNPAFSPSMPPGQRMTLLKVKTNAKVMNQITV